MLFLINSPKKTIAIETTKFFKNCFEEEISCTTSAISQQRKKLDYTFFVAWNKILVDAFYKFYGKKVKRWNGFIVVAVDGSTSHLFDKEEIVKYFGTHSNQYVKRPMARLMYAHDVYNDITIRSSILPIRYSEHHVLPYWIDRFKEDELGLYDRYYPSFRNIWLHEHLNKKYVMRCSVSENNVIKNFVSTGKRNSIVEFSATDSAIKSLKLYGYKITEQTKVKVRLVRIKLKNGDIERV